MPVVGDEEIDPAVVVVVAGAHARGPADAIEPDACGDVLERAVVLVAIQPAEGPIRRGPRHLAAARLLEPRAAQHERVEPAVAVVVDQAGAAAVRLEDESLAFDAAVDARMAQAGLLGDVGERDGPGVGRWRACRSAMAVRGCAGAEDASAAFRLKPEATQRLGRWLPASAGRLRSRSHRSRGLRSRSAISNSRFASSSRPVCCSSCASR